MRLGRVGRLRRTLTDSPPAPDDILRRTGGRFSILLSFRLSFAVAYRTSPINCWNLTF